MLFATNIGWRLFRPFQRDKKKSSLVMWVHTVHKSSFGQEKIDERELLHNCHRIDDDLILF